MDADDIARARSTPLEVVLEGFGAQRDPKDRRHNWKIGGSRITVHDDLFFDHNEAKGGAGALDLTLHLMGKDPKRFQATDFLAAVRWLGVPERAESAARHAAIAGAVPASVHAEAAAEPPVPDAGRIGRVRWYLTEQRAIPEELVERGIDAGLIYADSKANAVFRLKDETGAEMGFEKRGTYDRPFHSTVGRKGLFFVGNDFGPTTGRVAAFVESAIEALSYKALHPEALAVSTTGNALELPEKMGRLLLERGFQLRAAFNADRDGDRFSERLIASLGTSVERHRPDPRVGKDWNMVLKDERTGHRADLQEALAR